MTIYQLMKGDIVVAEYNTIIAYQVAVRLGIEYSVQALQIDV